MKDFAQRAGMPLLVRALLACAVGMAIIGRAVADNEGVERVATWQELEIAINEGAAHIVLTDHIDARLVVGGDCGSSVCTGASATRTAFQPLETLRSIRVRSRSNVRGCMLCGGATVWPVRAC